MNDEKVPLLEEKEDQDAEQSYYSCTVLHTTRVYNSADNEAVDQEPNETCKPTNGFSMKGTLLCVLSGVCLIAANTLTKLASDEVAELSSWQMLLLRSLVNLALSVPVLARTRLSLLGPEAGGARLRLGLQAVLANLMVVCVYTAMMRLPIGDFGAIVFSSPVFTMLLSVPVLKERCGVYRAAVALLLLAGVVTISRPPALFPPDLPAVPSNQTGGGQQQGAEKTTDIVGVAAAVAGAVLSASCTIIVKQISHLHYCLPMVWGALLGVLLALLALLVTDLVDSSSQLMFEGWTGWSWVLGLGQSLLNYVGVVLILLALRHVSPTQNKVIRSFQVVASYTLQVTLFGTRPHASDYAGAGLIMAAVMASVIETAVTGRCRDRLPCI